MLKYKFYNFSILNLAAFISALDGWWNSRDLLILTIISFLNDSRNKIWIPNIFYLFIKQTFTDQHAGCWVI